MKKNITNKTILRFLCVLMLLMLSMPIAQTKAYASSKVKVRVLIAVTDYYNGKRYASTSITYKKNGLISTFRNGGNRPDPIGGGAMFWNNRDYYYDKSNQLKKVKTDQRYVHGVDYTYRYDKKGRLKKSTTRPGEFYMGTNDHASKLIDARTFKYDKKGQIIKMTVENDFGKTVYNFAYKGSKLVKGQYEQFAYDKKGNLTRVTRGSYGETYSNFYKGNKLVKRTRDGGYKSVYKYRAIRVPRKLQKKIKAQQWALLNNNNNFALGIN